MTLPVTDCPKTKTQQINKKKKINSVLQETHSKLTGRHAFLHLCLHIIKEHKHKEQICLLIVLLRKDMLSKILATFVIN